MNETNETTRGQTPEAQEREKWSRARNTSYFRLKGMKAQVANAARNPIVTGAEREKLEIAARALEAVIEGWQKRNEKSKRRWMAECERASNSSE